MKSSMTKSLVPTLLCGGFFLILTVHVAGAQTDALRQSLFNETDIAMKAAENKDAAFYAPAAFSSGMASYKKAGDDFKKGKEIAEKTLEANRYDVTQAKLLANEASVEANHAIYLTQTIKRLTAEKKTLEEILLEAEVPIKTIADALGEPVRFDQGTEPPTRELTEAIGRLKEKP